MFQDSLDPFVAGKTAAFQNIYILFKLYKILTDLKIKVNCFCVFTAALGECVFLYDLRLGTRVWTT